MYNVYWTEKKVTNSKLFESSEMSSALTFMEGLRKKKHSGEDIAFVTMSSENPDSVGKQGVDVTGPDYNWKKRRI